MNVETFIQQELNDEQRKAVIEPKGSLLVIAGAGSGKTRVITSRIAYLLIKQQVQPHEIVALTFTNKAAKEMLERVKKFLEHHPSTPAQDERSCSVYQDGHPHPAYQDKWPHSVSRDDASKKSLNNFKESNKEQKAKVAHPERESKDSENWNPFEEQNKLQINLPFIGTFHSYCLRLLRENRSLLNLKNFSIMDAGDQLLLIKKIIERNCPKKIIPRQAVYALSAIKNSLFMENDDAHIDPLMKNLYTLYEHEKTLSNCLDFDDLLIKALDLFKNKKFKEHFQKTVRHILVDEYQDTSIVQHTLLKEMSLRGKKLVAESLCAVGDEDQSIYSWRGATVENIVNFHKTFPKTKRIKIEQNYRSAKPILDAANSIIKHNKNRHPKNLWSTRTGTNCVAHINCMSGFQEADIIAQGAKLLQQQKMLHSAAVLYRTHFQSRLIEEALLKQSIPYKIIGGIQFYERKEIKDMLTYLRLLVNPYDRVAFQRVINCPPRRLGSKFVEMFVQEWNTQPFYTYQDVAKNFIQEHKIKPQQAQNLNEFLSIFTKLSPETLTSQAIEKIAHASGYFNFLKNEYEPQDAEARIENIQELINAARYFEEQSPIEQSPIEQFSIEQFLQEVALVQEHKKKGADEQDCLQLMTLHAAKGLEFDTVFLAGLEEGILPSAKSLDSEADIEEERRLLYVGTTRARNKLLFLQAEIRHSYGKQTYQLPSRFLQELPNQGIQHKNSSFWKMYQIDSFLQNFLGIQVESNIQTFGPAPTYTKNPSKKTGQKSSLNLVQPATSWKKHHTVTHKKFGIGVIKDVDRRSDGSIHITAAFKAGTKKIDSKFLKQI